MLYSRAKTPRGMRTAAYKVDVAVRPPQAQNSPEMEFLCSILWKIELPGKNDGIMSEKYGNKKEFFVIISCFTIEKD